MKLDFYSVKEKKKLPGVEVKAIAMYPNNRCFAVGHDSKGAEVFCACGKDVVAKAKAEGIKIEHRQPKKKAAKKGSFDTYNKYDGVHQGGDDSDDSDDFEEISGSAEKKKKSKKHSKKHSKKGGEGECCEHCKEKMCDCKCKNGKDGQGEKKKSHKKPSSKHGGKSKTSKSSKGKKHSKK